MSEALLDRALGAYPGLAIGDAPGATVEFITPRRIMARYASHREIICGGWLRRLDPEIHHCIEVQVRQLPALSRPRPGVTR